MKRALVLFLGVLAALSIAIAPGRVEASPSTNPAPYAVDILPSNFTSCGSGFVCAWVYVVIPTNPPVGHFWNFQLYYCYTYGLDQFAGGGYAQNNQYGGTILAYSMTSSGGFYHGWYNNATTYSTDWNPAWYIKNC